MSMVSLLGGRALKTLIFTATRDPPSVQNKIRKRGSIHASSEKQILSNYPQSRVT
jgi:hypothetical protein